MSRIVETTGVGHPTKHALKIGRVGMCRYAKEFYHAAVRRVRCRYARISLAMH